MRNGNIWSEVQCERWMDLQLSLISSVLFSHLWSPGECVHRISLLKSLHATMKRELTWRPHCYVQNEEFKETSCLSSI